jgi:hypothetical protein
MTSVLVMQSLCTVVWNPLLHASSASTTTSVEIPLANVVHRRRAALIGVCCHVHFGSASMVLLQVLLQAFVTGSFKRSQKPVSETGMQPVSVLEILPDMLNPACAFMLCHVLIVLM